MNIARDFLGDCHRVVLHELQQIDVSIAPTMDPHDLCIRYVNWRMRQIPQGPRAVHAAPELQCPTHLVAGFEALKDKSRMGDDLWPPHGFHLNPCDRSLGHPPLRIQRG